MVEKRSHTGVQPHFCNDCGKSFTTAASLKKHRAHSSAREEIFPCEYCGKSFTQSSSPSLREHIREIQPEEKPYPCNICSTYFATDSDLERHKLIHAGYRHLLCDDCGKSFSEPSELQLHRREAALV